MTRDELIAALTPVRLPAGMQFLDWREMLALFGLGLILAALIALILTPLLTRRRSRRQELRGTRGQPVGERLLSLARLSDGLPASLREVAYRRDPDITDAQIEGALRQRKRRR